MKRSTIAATVLAAALLIFVFFKFYPAKPTAEPFNITGEWQLDSVYATQPSDSLGLFLTAMANKEGNKPFVRFNTDSTVLLNDSTTGKYYVQDSVLYISDGKSSLSYSFQTMTDSLVVMTSKDSVGLVLKKK